ncbi:MAG TPA: lactate racemase domain-containing protein, partial [Thermomicrobiaceae bacterium]|nr:lactate racemase domain-containing protein [Thermomicrobiaceae bacterium]
MRAPMRSVTIPYGDGEIRFAVPGRGQLQVVGPNPTQPALDVVAELRRALDHPIDAPPLREAVRGARDVLILADDLTRQTPVDRMIPL